MGKTIEIRLSDAQHAALIAEAEAAGRHLFDYCRSKLMVGTDAPPRKWSDHEGNVTPTPRRLRLTPHPSNLATQNGKAVTIRESSPAAPDDARMSRIEDTLARLSEYVLGGQQPTEPQPEQPRAPIDVDSMVSAQFAEAEAHGLAEHVPDEAEIQMAQSGVRSLSRRPIPFSASSGPRHLRELG